MTATESCAAKCRTLWGAMWCDPASKALGISKRALQRIKAADRDGVDMPDAEGVLRALGELLSDVSALE
jgi:hypothetical protein